MSELEDRAMCEELFLTCAPFVRAEQEAEDALKAAKKTLRTARKMAAVARAAWVENILKHDHPAICHRNRAAVQAAGERAGEA